MNPTLDYPPLHMVRMSAATHGAGVETHTLEKAEVPIFGVAKTVADCFKYRSKIGRWMWRSKRCVKAGASGASQWMNCGTTLKFAAVANVMRALLGNGGGAMKTPTNVAASVRQKLLNLSQERGEDFNALLSRFAAERFLYRVGVSRYRDNLLLKGAALFAVWEQVPRRPTRDVDFLGIGQAAPEHLMTMFQQLCLIECPEDGVVFNAQSVEVMPIRAEDFTVGIACVWRHIWKLLASAYRLTSALAMR